MRQGRRFRARTSRLVRKVVERNATVTWDPMEAYGPVPLAQDVCKERARGCKCSGTASTKVSAKSERVNGSLAVAEDVESPTGSFAPEVFKSHAYRNQLACVVVA